jgi:hypothetical protein
MLFFCKLKKGFPASFVLSLPNKMAKAIGDVFALAVEP